MAGQGDADSAPSTTSGSKWPHDWRWLKSLGAVGAVAAVVIAAVNLSLNISSRQTQNRHYKATSDVSAPGDSAPAVNASPSSSALTTQLAVGQCLSGSGHVVPCGVPHQSEVLSLRLLPCPVRSATTYLGGDPDVDVLVDGARPSRLAGTTACVIGAGAPITGSVKGILLGSLGDSWRRCIDYRGKPHDVPCDLSHTGEYVGVEAAAPDLRQCESAAQTYLATTIDQVAAYLKVSSLSVVDIGNGQPRCLLSVRGADLLTASVRNLGPNTLPLVPPN